jgi:hypothetical protein
MMRMSASHDHLFTSIYSRERSRRGRGATIGAKHIVRINI